MGNKNHNTNPTKNRDGNNNKSTRLDIKLVISSTQKKRLAQYLMSG